MGFNSTEKLKNITCIWILKLVLLHQLTSTSPKPDDCGCDWKRIKKKKMISYFISLSETLLTTSLQYTILWSNTPELWITKLDIIDNLNEIHTYCSTVLSLRMYCHHLFSTVSSSRFHQPLNHQSRFWTSAWGLERLWFSWRNTSDLITFAWNFDKKRKDQMDTIHIFKYL